MDFTVLMLHLKVLVGTPKNLGLDFTFHLNDKPVSIGHMVSIVCCHFKINTYNLKEFV